MSRALLVANDDLRDAGFVGEELERRGYRFEAVSREQGNWPGLGGVDLVVLLGSDWHLYDDERRAAVAAEAALVRAAHGRGTPIMGICFGAQMLSHALGGTVRRSDALEVGWMEVETLVPDVPAGPWMQWHTDTFTVPADATLLARSPVGPQCFRAGRSLAVQFHPEVDAATIASWIEGDSERDLARAGLDADELLARTEEEVVHSEPAARALVGWFCTAVAGG